MQRIVACMIALVLISIPVAARAEDRPLHLSVFPPNKPGTFDKGMLYAVELSCKKTGDLLPHTVTKVFAKKIFTTSLSVLISRQAPNKKTDGTDNLPATAVAYAPIVVVDKDNGVQLNNADACDQAYLVSNASQLFLIPTVSLSETYQAGFFLNFISKAIDVATAVAPIFLTGGIPVPIAGKLSDAQKAIPPINSLLETLNKASNYAITQNLRVGTTVVRTDYANITITVRPVTSIVADKNKDFIDSLKKGIDGAPSKFTASDPKPNCTPIAVALNNAGFKAEQDKAFALGYLGLITFQTKEQIMSCLGQDYVVAAAQLGDQLWKGVPSALVVTPDDALNFRSTSPSGPAQPPFQQLRADLTDLMNALGQYARRDLSKPAPVDTVNRILKQFATSVAFQDQTGGAFGSFAQTFSVPAVPALVDFLISKGFRRYGCFAETTDATGRVESGASVILLAFNAEPNAPKTTIANAIAIHPLYRNRVIESLRISDNSSGWIDSVLADRSKAYYCANLEVQK
ncbi:MAG: hypothetical protein ACXWJ8_07465 [Xanthobacteraceae bacterium]